MLNVKGDPADAAAKIARSVELDPYYDLPLAMLADYHARQARSLPAGDGKTNELEQALASYQKAVQINPKNFKYILAAGETLAGLNRYDQALQVYQQALGANVMPPDQLWRMDEHIAQVYLAMKEKSSAMESIGRAMQAAPQAEQAALQVLQKEINALP